MKLCKSGKQSRPFAQPIQNSYLPLGLDFYFKKRGCAKRAINLALSAQPQYIIPNSYFIITLILFDQDLLSPPYIYTLGQVVQAIAHAHA